MFLLNFLNDLALQLLHVLTLLCAAACYEQSCISRSLATRRLLSTYAEVFLTGSGIIGVGSCFVADDVDNVVERRRDSAEKSSLGVSH